MTRKFRELLKWRSQGSAPSGVLVEERLAIALLHFVSAVPAIGSRIIVGLENGVVKSDLLLVHLAKLVLVLVPFLFCAPPI